MTDNFKSFDCSFCNSTVPKTYDTFRTTQCYFNSKITHTVTTDLVNTAKIDINMYYCPKCSHVHFIAIGKDSLDKLKVPIYPIANFKLFPDYIPNFIIKDYQEAYSILNLSPKASATLSRRCLQGMIRDFWGISKSRLIDEINSLKDLIPASQWKAIDGLRSLGNIGAHMEKDVNIILDIEPNEAEQLIKLIELLIDKWYIARHDEEELLNNITSIANTKKTKN